MNQPLMHRVTTLDLTCEPWRWPFAHENRAAITAHFAQVRALKPAMFNGRILLMNQFAVAGDRLTGRFFETDFASFLAWRDFGFPGETVTNCFGMGALRDRDGVFLLGEMSAHTANAGRIYFPSGTPDASDLVQGQGGHDRVDIAGSIIREVAEETGLTAADYEAEPGFTCIAAKPHLAVMRILTLKQPARAVRQRILVNVATHAVPEFSDVHLVRGTGDIKPAMPDFVAAYIRAMVGTEPARADI